MKCGNESRKMTTFTEIKVQQIKQKVESVVNKHRTKHLFQAIYFVRRIHFVAENNLVYALLRIM